MSGGGEFCAVLGAPLALDRTGTKSRPARSRIQVAEVGKFKDPGRYGDFEIKQSDVDNWKRLLQSHFHGRIPIDEDHKTDKGISSEAQGWIVELEQSGTEVYATVEWTSDGEQKIRDKKFLYISPVFRDELLDQRGQKLGPALLRAALTNNPFLHNMPAVTLSRHERALEGVAVTTPDPEPLRWLDVEADVDLMHALARDVAHQLGRDPVDMALEMIDHVEELATGHGVHVADRMTRDGAILSRGLSVDRVLEHFGVSVDVGKLKQRVDERLVALGAAIEAEMAPAVPDGRVLDADGVTVKYGPDTDLDALMADDIQMSRDFRRARDFKADERGDVLREDTAPLTILSREDFAEEWRASVDAGIDLVATLENQRLGQDARNRFEPHETLENRARLRMAEEDLEADRLLEQQRQQRIKVLEAAAAVAQDEIDRLRRA